MRKRNFPRHRYKHGKQTKGIELATFSRMLAKVDKINLGKYTPLMIKSFLALLYWTGLRKTEVHGAKRHRYVLPPTKGPGHKEPIVRYTEPIPGILKEDMWIQGGYLYVRAVARKHGKREAPLMLPLEFPYVDLIVEQWKQTQPKQRVFPISEWDSWNIMKQIDKRRYPHFFRFNRITEMCSDPELSIAEICSWTGLTPQTIGEYMERSGRFIRSTAEKMRKRYGGLNG